MDSLNMHKEVLSFKCSQIPAQGIAYLPDKKKQLLFIANSKSIKIYNLTKKQLQDTQVSGIISAITVSDDLVFYAQGTYVGAVGSNGKNIFELNTFIASEKINRIHVTGYQLWVITGPMINQFLMAGPQLGNKASRRSPSPAKQTQDKNSFVFQSDINSSQLYEQQLQKPFLVLLKNNNQVICYDQKQLCSRKVESPPLSICKYSNGGEYKNRFLIGCAGGQIYCIEVSRKQIQQKWLINDNSTKINQLVEVRNQSFFAFRDQSIEIWGRDRSILANQEIDVKDKVNTTLYLDGKQLMFCGTANGNIVQMGDYTAMMKNYKSKNQKVSQQTLEKQVGSLEKELQNLKAKLQLQGKNQPDPSANFKVTQKITVNYKNLCYSLSLTSEQKIKKVILRGPITIPHDNRIVFEGKQTKNINVYVIQQEGINQSIIDFKKQQEYISDSKLKILVYISANNKNYGVSKFMDIRPMIYHHKIPGVKLENSNLLQIGGPFKYFEINLWLNMIFNDFGPANEADEEEYYQAYYESILTKQKIAIKYRNGECSVRAENTGPLVIIKKFLSDKSKEKHISFNTSVQLNEQTINNMLGSLQSTIKQFQKLKEEYQLLPALMQLKNDESLSEDLKRVLMKSAQIKSNYQNIKVKYQILLQQLCNSYTSYQQLKDNQITQFDIDIFKRQLNKFDRNKIAALILK